MEIERPVHPARPSRPATIGAVRRIFRFPLGHMSIHHPSSFESADRIDTVTMVALPGMGKGTLINNLKKDLAVAGRTFEHLEVGEIVRDHVKRDTPLGRKAKEWSSKGLLLPDEDIIPEIELNVAKLDPDALWLLDGVPRSPEQMKAFLNIMDRRNRTWTAAHLFSQEGEEAALQRMERRMQEAMQKGEKVRPDDASPASRKRRLEEAQKLTALIPEFDSMGRLIRIDASGEIAETWRQGREKILTLVFDHEHDFGEMPLQVA